MIKPIGPQSSELDPLLAELLDGQISEDRFVHLQALLASSPELRDYYVEFFSQFSDMCEVAALSAGMDDRVVGSPASETELEPIPPVMRSGFSGESGGAMPMLGPGEGRRPEMPRIDPDEVGTDRGRAISSSSSSESSTDRPKRGRPSPRRSWMPWTITAAACLITFLTNVLVFVVWRRQGAVRPGPLPVPLAAPESPAGVDRWSPSADGSMAMVIKLDGARWEPAEGPPPSEGAILARRRLLLISGRATLGLLNGVVLTLEGPADLELVSIDRVFCQRGKLRAWVPPNAEGFVVAAPGASVVDLGTEFALNVGDDGRAQVMVFEGEAEAAVIGAAGTPERSQLVEQSRAFEIDSRTGLITEAVARAESFVKPPALVAPELDLDASYRDAVLASRPWGYWRFEAMSDGAIPNEIPGRPPLRATGDIRLSAAEPGNRSAVFKAKDIDHYLLMDDRWEPSPEAGYAIELWVLTKGIRNATLANLITDGPPRSSPHLLALELTASERHTHDPPASVRFLHRWPPGNWGGDNLFSSGLYVPYRWHHVVAQFADRHLELYLDGIVCRSARLATDDVSMPARLVFGRLHTLAGEPAHRCRAFYGLMDEVAVYDHPLTAEEILDRYHRAIPRADPSER